MGGSSAAPEHSASTIAAEEVTGSHVLTVDGYTRTKMWLVAGQFIRSATFAVAGHRWSISYYPVGTNADDSDYISLFLHLEPTDARAGFLIPVGEKNRNPPIQPIYREYRDFLFLFLFFIYFLIYFLV